jgi:hypothetical protein
LHVEDFAAKTADGADFADISIAVAALDTCEI